MDKFYEKRNFGIPSTILCVIAYLIGYVMSSSIGGGLLVAVIFAAAVFLFQFDERVKNAVKVSYVVAFIANLVELALSLLEKVNTLITPKNDIVSVLNMIRNYEAWEDINAFQKILWYIYQYGGFFLDLVVALVFLVFIIKALRNKDKSISFVNNILKDSASNARQGQSGTTCPSCGKVNQGNATFCAGCGAKLK